MLNPSAKCRMGNTTTIAPPSGVETMIIVCSTTRSSNSGASSGESRRGNPRAACRRHADLTWLAKNGRFGAMRRKSFWRRQTWFADCSRLMNWWLWRLRQSSWIVSSLGIVGLRLPVLLAPRETQPVATMSASKRQRKWRTVVLCTTHGMRSATGESVSRTANTVALFLTCLPSGPPWVWTCIWTCLKRLNPVRFTNRYLYYHSEKKYWTLGIGSTDEGQNEWYLRSAPTDCYSPLVAPWLDSKSTRYRAVVPHELDVNGYPEPNGGKKTKYRKVGCWNEFAQA